MVTEHGHFAQYVEPVEVTYNPRMPNSHDIPLKRIAVEAVVIVTSILLAFAIDAWWDERQERIEETEVLLGLKSEFSRYRDDLAKSIEYHANVRLLTEELMASTRRGSWDSGTLSIDYALITLSDPEFEILLEFRYTNIAHIALEYETAMQAMTGILDAIDDSLY